MTTESTEIEAAAAPPSRWPKVVGTIGVVLGAIMSIDKINDLAVVPLIWGEESRQFLFGLEMGELIARTVPRWTWISFYILCGMALGMLLIVASLRLRRRSPSGITLCRAWAWLSIVWLAVALTWVLWWLGRHGDEISKFAEAGWQTETALGGALAVTLLLAYPVFLLVWLSRGAVKEDYSTWRE